MGYRNAIWDAGHKMAISSCGRSLGTVVAGSPCTKKARSWGDRARGGTTGGTDMAPTIKVWADETLSSRCWRLSLAGTDWPRKLVDGLFLLFGELDHCREAYESERLGRQLPPELRR